MELVHGLSQTQKLIMSQSMAQSLTVLQLPTIELRQYIMEQAMENPLLDVVEPEAVSMELPAVSVPEDPIWEEEEPSLRTGKDSDAGVAAQFPLYKIKEEKFTEMLHRQLLEDKRIPEKYLPLCDFLVDCLNKRGYLEDPIELLADIAGASTADMTQALYILQEMTPAGVGARSLQECLVLQLAQTPDFCAGTLKLIREALDLLAANQLRQIAKLLKVSEAEAAAYCAAVRRLNPIPSRGYDTGDDGIFVIPEAEVLREGEHWSVRYNGSAIPKVSINLNYCAMLKDSSDPQLTAYLKQNMGSANSLIHALDARKSTIVRVLEALVDWQKDFFEYGFSALRPLVISDIADRLDLSISTVSRAVQGKSIATPVGVVELKRLFSAASSAKSDVSAASVRERLKALIASEDKRKPLSDEKLCQAIQALGITISRRTVAKYRDALGIPAASQRIKI